VIGHASKAIGALEYRERTRHYDILFQEASDFRLISTLLTTIIARKVLCSGPKALDLATTVKHMSLKIDLSQFSLKQFRSYARFDNGQEEKLRSYLDYDFAIEFFVRALETAIKIRPGVLIGGVPLGESTAGGIVFQITCMQRVENGVAWDDFFTAVCHREAVEQFCAELQEQYQRPAAIYLSESDPELMKPKPVRLHHQRAVKVVSPNGLPVKCVDRTSRWGNPFKIGVDGTREEIIQKYRAWFLTGTDSRKVGRYIVDPQILRERIRELRGFNLACCPPGLPCHADFLLAQANQPESMLQIASAPITP
jgi:hypothetical protein